ncbi:MAG: hypothetical protein RR639_02835 [Hydrogenoanaerobacterium sp.]
MLKKRAAALLVALLIVFTGSVTAYAAPSLAEQALPLGTASIKGKKIKHYYDPIFGPIDSIGTYKNPMGTWYGQPEPDIDKLPIKEFRDKINSYEPNWFENNYTWEPLLGGWADSYYESSTDPENMEITLIFPFDSTGSTIGTAIPYEPFKKDKTFLRYKWRAEPKNTPGAELAKANNAVWFTSEGAWIYEVSRMNIYGEMAPGWARRIYPNGMTAGGAQMSYHLRHEKERAGMGFADFPPPNRNAITFPNALFYIEYTDGSWGYVPLPVDKAVE